MFAVCLLCVLILCFHRFGFGTFGSSPPTSKGGNWTQSDEGSFKFNRIDVGRISTFGRATHRGWSAIGSNRSDLYTT